MNIIDYLKQNNQFINNTCIFYFGKNKDFYVNVVSVILNIPIIFYNDLNNINRTIDSENKIAKIKNIINSKDIVILADDYILDSLNKLSTDFSLGKNANEVRDESTYFEKFAIYNINKVLDEKRLSFKIIYNFNKKYSDGTISILESDFDKLNLESTKINKFISTTFDSIQDDLLIPEDFLNYISYSPFPNKVKGNVFTRYEEYFPNLPYAPDDIELNPKYLNEYSYQDINLNISQISELQRKGYHYYSDEDSSKPINFKGNCENTIMNYINAAGRIDMKRSHFLIIHQKFGRLEFIKALYNLINKGILSFPYYKLVEPSGPVNMFNRILRDENEDLEKINNKKFDTLPGVFISKENKNKFPFTFLNPDTNEKEYLTFITEDYYYSAYDAITNYFTEDVRMKSVVKKAGISPYDWFRQKENIEYMINVFYNNDHQEYAYNFSSSWIREFLHIETKEATLFKVTLVRSVINLIKEINNDSIRMLDFSSGWGDRLIGSIVCDVDYYQGFDPNRELIPGHSEIIKTFVNPEKRDRFNIVYEPFEKVSLNPNKTYNLVFTSPPYFDFELYTKQDEGQSYVSFPQYESWLKGFLFVALSKAWSVLESKGFMVIHISDTKTMPQVCEYMNLFISSLPKSQYIGVIASLSSHSELRRPMWVWRKN